MGGMPKQNKERNNLNSIDFQQHNVPTSLVKQIKHARHEHASQFTLMENHKHYAKLRFG